MNIAGKLSPKSREEMYRWYEQKMNSASTFRESLEAHESELRFQREYQLEKEKQERQKR